MVKWNHLLVIRGNPLVLFCSAHNWDGHANDVCIYKLQGFGLEASQTQTHGRKRGFAALNDQFMSVVSIAFRFKAGTPPQLQDHLPKRLLLVR